MNDSHKIFDAEDYSGNISIYTFYSYLISLSFKTR
uniref:Uncharacterized protein n=1 Tax=Amphimedon queenslandica TaxID=400682 RepID=A0A1X7TN36_AMPQE